MNIAAIYEKNDFRTQWKELRPSVWSKSRRGTTCGLQSDQQEWMSLQQVSVGDTAELSGGQRPESVLDEGSVRAGNQGQSGVEIVSQCSTEEERAPVEARRGQKA